MAGMHEVSTAFMFTSLVFTRSSDMYEWYFEYYFRYGNTWMFLIAELRGSQRDVVYLGWRITSSYMSSNAGGLWGFSQLVQLCTWSPNKLWRSNSILTQGRTAAEFSLLVVLHVRVNFTMLFVSPDCAFYWRFYCDLDLNKHKQVLEHYSNLE